MKIYTVTFDGQPLAVVRASDEVDAIATARELAEEQGVRDFIEARHMQVRDPNDAEMVSWLERRDDHLLVTAAVSQLRYAS
jgi:hypothetical protein